VAAAGAVNVSKKASMAIAAAAAASEELLI
jgi:hypothetical protein